MISIIKRILSKPITLERIGFWISDIATKVGRPIKCAECGRPLGRFIVFQWTGHIFTYGLHTKCVRASFNSQYRLAFTCADQWRCGAHRDPEGQSALPNHDIENRRIVHVVLAHEAPSYVDRLMEYLSEADPDTERVLVYGGKEEAFSQIRFENKVFCRDPRLRGLGWRQSYQGVFRAAFSMIHDNSPHVILFTEGDQIPLRRNSSTAIKELLKKTGADFLAWGLNDVTDSNMDHYQRMRSKSTLQRTINRISVRRDKSRWFHCLGTGLVVVREALDAYCEAYDERDQCYLEIEIATLLYHLGYRGANILSTSNLYDHVRYRPEYTGAEILELADQGAWFIHPCKSNEFQNIHEKLIEKMRCDLVELSFC